MEQSSSGKIDLVKVRAANFFALQALWPNPKELSAVWDVLSDEIDTNVPLAAHAVPALGRLDVDGDQLTALFETAYKSLDELSADDSIVERDTPGYPLRLGALPDSPRFLFIRMESPAIFDAPSLAVVGTRRPSENGQRRARKLAYLLAKRGITVVSGLARGIDEAAHQGTLEVGGRTIAVIGTPITRTYPKEHVELQRRIGRVGAVVSQFYPGATTMPWSFPLRNATMSGLALGTVIVEASETSGALIQAQHCISQGRKLFIPRSAVENPELNWPRKYLDRGATMFSTIEELIETLDSEGLLPPPDPVPAEAAEALDLRVARG